MKFVSFLRLQGTVRYHRSYLTDAPSTEVRRAEMAELKIPNYACSSVVMYPDRMIQPLAPVPLYQRLSTREY